MSTIPPPRLANKPILPYNEAVKDPVLAYAQKDITDLFTHFNSSAEGLSTDAALRSIVEFGPNTLENTEVTWWQVLSRQFKSPFIYLLVGAGVLSIILGHPQDALFILLFISVNTVLGFYQEYKSEQTAKLLKKFVESMVTVVRDNKEVLIPSQHVVPGDIVLLNPGDRAQADLRLIESQDLTIDESILTGESEAQQKNSDTLKEPVEHIYEATNLVYSGTTVVSGNAKAIVLYTGKSRVFGKIVQITSDATRVSSFEKGIANFSAFILKVVGVTLFCMVLANLVVKGGNLNIPEFLLFAIALAVSVIPEALPVVTTFSLSQGARRLAKNKVVVKRLSSIEDLGSISVLCTDKTGTITENHMRLATHLMYKGADVLHIAALASNFLETKKVTEQTNSFDEGLFHALDRDRLHLLSDSKKIRELPFDPLRRRVTVLVKTGKTFSLISKGAPEDVMALCSKIEKRKDIESWIEKEGRLGRRIMAIAQRKVTSGRIDLKKEEKQMTLVGFLSYEDPLKESTVTAVHKARMLGVSLKILTGDRPEVAGAVAHQIGLIDNPNDVMTGDVFQELTVEKRLEAVDRYAVFARVSPVQKYEIVQLLEQKHEVGFLGEGINDAPALKVANVGIVVQSASDISKDAADIILLNKSLLTIIEGIEEGRTVFANTVKYIRSTLTSNFGNFYAIAISSLFIPFLPMLPIQILLVNLLTDFPMISVSGDNVDPEELRSPKSYQIREVATVATVLGLVSTAFDFLTFALFFRMAPAVLQTNWFMESILTELVLLYSIRTRKIFFKGPKPSRTMSVLTAVAIVLTVTIPFTLLGREKFSFVPPSLFHFITIIGIVMAYFTATETVKLALYKFTRQQTKQSDIIHAIG